MAYINYRCMKAVGLLVKVCGIRRRNVIVVVEVHYVFAPFSLLKQKDMS